MLEPPRTGIEALSPRARNRRQPVVDRGVRLEPLRRARDTQPRGSRLYPGPRGPRRTARGRGQLTLAPAPVLAGAGALAALLADPANGDGLSFAKHPLHAVLVCVGIAGAVGALVSAILVLATRDFGFSVDAEQLYDAAFADREHPEVYLLRIAESHRLRRVANRDGVRALQRFLVGGLSELCSRSLASRRPSPYSDGIAATPQSAPKPAATPAPAPQPPKIEPYANIFFVEGKALGTPGGRRSG